VRIPIVSWTVTFSLRDGCFRAYIWVVMGSTRALNTERKWETLTIDEGCFPFDLRPYRHKSNYLFLFFIFIDWKSWVPFGHNDKQCFTIKIRFKTHYLNSFRRIQLSPSSIGISPLFTSHPRALQRSRVRSSTNFQVCFKLLINRSLGFGSFMGLLFRFHYAFSLAFPIKLAHPLYKRYAITPLSSNCL